MVIVEYCKFGNLSAYLRSKRGEFVPYKVQYNGLFGVFSPYTIFLFLGENVMAVLVDAGYSVLLMGMRDDKDIRGHLVFPLAPEMLLFCYC